MGFDPNLKRGSMELLILSVLRGGKHHGYEIGKLIEHRSGGSLEFRVSTLYSTLYRMEEQGWIKGRWVEREGERRRCYYTLTPEGREALGERHRRWQEFSAVIDQVIAEAGM